jgi:REP element-mobilizing transposase RayT
MSHRFKVVSGGPYPHFITLSIARWLPVFVEGRYIEIVLSSLEHVRSERGLAIHAYVIMPTHLHLIVTALRDDLPAVIRDFKKFTARRLYEQMEEDGWKLHTWMFPRGDLHSRVLHSKGGLHPPEPGPQGACGRRREVLPLERLRVCRW